MGKKLVYSRAPTPLADKTNYRNPRHFGGAEKGVSHVLIVGDHPEIAEAYDAAGAKVEVVNGVADFTPVALDPGSAPIPEGWHNLPWNDLRALAGNIDGKAATNRAAAGRVVRGEILRRSNAPQQTAVGQVAAVEAAHQAEADAR